MWLMLYSPCSESSVDLLLTTSVIQLLFIVSDGVEERLLLSTFFIVVHKPWIIYLPDCIVCTRSVTSS